MSENTLWIKCQKGQGLPNLQVLAEGFFQIKGFITNDKYYFRLYDNAIFQFDEKKLDIPQSYLILDFDLHFEVIRQKSEKNNVQLGKPKGFVFDKFGQKSELLCTSEQQIYQWRDILRNKLNQRGFHELYKAQKKIGKGNFASVYLADRIEDGKSFAVKAFSKEAAYSQENGKESLINEIELMRALNHPNIIRLHEVFETENSLYLILDLYTGGLLYDKMKAKYRFSPDEVRHITQCLLEGIAEMHRNNIMHRDLKPENLIFKSAHSSEIAIVDLGLATRTNLKKFMFVRCGTPGFVAPEVINIIDFDLIYDSVCDIFSLGLIFHILLIGKSPFNGKDYNEILTQNRASNITFEGQEYQKISADAFDLLKRMLQKDPQQRITAVQALQHQYFQKNYNEMDIEQDEDKIKQYEDVLRKKMISIGNNSPLPSPQIIQQKGGANKNLYDEQGIFKMPNTPVLTGRTDAVNYEGFNSPGMQIDQRSIMQMGTQNSNQSPQVKRKSLFGSPQINLQKRNVQQQIGKDTMQEEKIEDEEEQKDNKANKKSNVVRNNLINLGI